MTIITITIHVQGDSAETEKELVRFADESITKFAERVARAVERIDEGVRARDAEAKKGPLPKKGGR